MNIMTLLKNYAMLTVKIPHVSQNFGTFFLTSPTRLQKTSVRNVWRGLPKDVYSLYGVSLSKIEKYRVKSGKAYRVDYDFLRGGYVTLLHARFGTTFPIYHKNCTESGKFPYLDEFFDCSADNTGFAKSSEYFAAQWISLELVRHGFSINKIFGEKEVITSGIGGGVAYGTDGTFLITQGKKKWVFPLQVTICTRERYYDRNLQEKVLQKLFNTRRAIMTMTNKNGVRGRKSAADILEVPVFGATIVFVVRNKEVAAAVRGYVCDVMAADESYKNSHISCTILIALQATTTSFMHFELHDKRTRSSSEGTGKKTRPRRRRRHSSMKFS